MKTKTFGLVEELIVATRDYLTLPYANRESAERARSGYRDAKERLDKAVEEEALGGRSCCICGQTLRKDAKKRLDKAVEEEALGGRS